MAFTDAQLAEIDATVGALVQRRRPPAELRDQVDLELEIDGHRVRILEIRASYLDPTQSIRSGIAQFTWTGTTGRWTLSWQRRDLRWHVWKPAAHLTTLPELVKVVDEDRQGGFWS